MKIILLGIAAIFGIIFMLTWLLIHQIKKNEKFDRNLK